MATEFEIVPEAELLVWAMSAEEALEFFKGPGAVLTGGHLVRVVKAAPETELEKAKYNPGAKLYAVRAEPWDGVAIPEPCGVVTTNFGTEVERAYFADEDEAGGLWVTVKLKGMEGRREIHAGSFRFIGPADGSTLTGYEATTARVKAANAFMVFAKGLPPRPDHAKRAGLNPDVAGKGLGRLPKR